MLYPALFDNGLAGLLETVPHLRTTLPGMDAYEEDNKLVVRFEVPGFEKGKIAIASERGRLTIKAERKDEDKGRRYLIRSRSTSSFSQTVTIPEEYDEEKAEANYEAGVLAVTIPKRDQARGRRIEVR